MVMSMEHRSDGDNFGIGPRRMRPPPPPKPGLVGRRQVTRGAPGGLLDLEVAVLPDKALQLIGEALLQAGCDIYAADSNGRTPLMYAARYQRPTAVRLLLEHGANAKAKDKNGMTALDLARQSGNEKIIRLLEQGGVRALTIPVKTIAVR